jgi:hypothetical protein
VKICGLTARSIRPSLSGGARRARLSMAACFGAYWSSPIWSSAGRVSRTDPSRLFDCQLHSLSARADDRARFRRSNTPPEDLGFAPSSDRAQRAVWLWWGNRVGLPRRTASH